MNIAEKLKKDSEPCICEVCIFARKKETAKVRKTIFREVVKTLNKEISRFEISIRGVGIITRFDAEKMLNEIRKKLIETTEKI